MQRLLEMQGGLYSFEDIVELIKAGELQSFCSDETWIVTRIDNFPRKRVLNIFLVVGDMDKAKAMEPVIIDFAKEVGAEMLTAYGRPGWERVASEGWNSRYVMYDKVI